eukprot:TRINITY_DN15758_c0_g1_i1.p3 TRINITY_DN15758_c0_g1~~TRINITY_DN15758_c0_g1_i1.p3  ORF type:complete len:100 (-),score=20.78 TRINITY_DN15758_c0_g1_i1:552-851(-)
MKYNFFFFKQKTAYEMLRSLVGSEMCIRDSTRHPLEETISRIAIPSSKIRDILLSSSRIWTFSRSPKYLACRISSNRLGVERGGETGTASKQESEIESS